MMHDQPKDAWDKTSIILQPVGGLMTALAVALVGILASQFLDRQQAAETNVRVYADLMSKREESDSSLRKDMFQSIIKTFLEPKAAASERKVVGLELLADNFHDSLNLGPLFRHVYQTMDPTTKEGKQYIERLESVAIRVSSKQVDALQHSGGKVDGFVAFDKNNGNLAEGMPVVVDTDLIMASQDSQDLPEDLRKRHFQVWAVGVNKKRKELHLLLKVATPEAKTGAHVQAEDADNVLTNLWVGLFDFPAIENIRLAHGQRCAIAFRNFKDDHADITLVYFPGSRASLKEKPYYEEIMDSMGRVKAGSN